MELTKKQEEGLRIALERYRNGDKYVTIAGYAGTGKAQPLDTKIPTSKGFKNLGDLKVGDFVFDRKGEPTKVLGVFPQGKKKVYKVSFVDGRSSLCAGDHLWTIYDKNNKIITKTTFDLLDEGLDNRCWIPINLTAKYPIKDYEHYPYTEGMVLGIESYDKNTHIPEDYKIGSAEQRLQLLQGIIDFTGSFNDGKIEITSKSKQLVFDVQEILWSLGFTSEIRYDDDFIYLSSYIGVWDKPTKLLITSIKELDYDTEMVCIYVDNDEHLYLTEDYIVTHNTTLVRFIIEALDVDEDNVCYCAYTGKAAEVLRRKGNRNALTTHKLLYKFQPLEDGTFIKVKKDELEYSIIVIDEVSMFPKSMLEDLLKHENIFVIFLGDPFQLEQISKNDSHDLLERPHIFLDEIMRQAAESEIIQLTMKIRAGEKIDFSSGKEVIVIPSNQFVTGHLLWADQVLCATNATRNALNNQMRELLGYSGDPKEGEKMICLRNYWDKASLDKECALVNGMTGTLVNPFTRKGYLPRWVRAEEKNPEYLMSGFQSEDGARFATLNMDKKLIMIGQNTYTPEEIYNLRGLVKKVGFNPVPFEFAFGYCITCHKSQGSSWGKVTVVEENFPYGKEEHAHWLYTACTRAAEKLVLIRKD